MEILGFVYVFIALSTLLTIIDYPELVPVERDLGFEMLLSIIWPITWALIIYYNRKGRH